MSNLLQRTADQLKGPVFSQENINTGPGTFSRENMARSPVYWVPLEQVQDNPFQPRLRYDAEHILNLALSIKQLKRELPSTKGLQQLPLARLGRLTNAGEFDMAPRLLYGEPLELRKLLGEPSAGAQLMFGHSRLRAFRVLCSGLMQFDPTTLANVLTGGPQLSTAELGIDIDLADVIDWQTRYAELMEPDADYSTIPLTLGFALDLDMWRHAITENSQRKNITPIEEAQALQQAVELFGLTLEEAGRPFGYSNRSTVSNKVRLLNLPAEVQRDIATGVLSERHGRELLRLADDPKMLKDAYRDAIKGGKTVAQLAQNVKWMAEQIENKQEKGRQLEIARAILKRGWAPPGSTEPLPAGQVGDVNYFFDRPDDKAILESGLCGSRCECCMLAYRTYNEEGMVRPDAEQAPRIGLGCAGGWEAMNPKRAALRKLQSEARIGPNEAERRIAEENAQKAAKVADLRREAQAKWDKALAKLDKVALWQDIRLWRLIFENPSYSYTSMAKKAQSITEFQQMIFDQLLEGTRRYDRALGDYVPDPSRLDQMITALTQPLEKPDQPGPGCRPAPGWEEGWTEDDQVEYDELTRDGRPDEEILAYVSDWIDGGEFDSPRVLLRLIEECDDKAIRGHFWRYYNELVEIQSE